MHQVFDLVDSTVILRCGQMVANLKKADTDPQDMFNYITGAKTGDSFIANV